MKYTDYSLILDIKDCVSFNNHANFEICNTFEPLDL